MDIIKFAAKLPSRYLKDDAKLETLFKGRVPVQRFQEQMRNVRELIIELTGTDIKDIGNYQKDCIYLSPVNLGMRKSGSIELMIGASLFEPCIAYDFESWGYSMKMFFRGPARSAEKGFDDAVEKLGFPGDVTPPPNFPILDRMLGVDPSEMPNNAGWDIAKKIIRNHGAELKKVHYNICRFPYSLLIKECEGRVLDKDLGILGDNTANDFLRKFYVTD